MLAPGPRGFKIAGHESAPEANKYLDMQREKKLRQSGKYTETQIKDIARRQKKHDEKMEANRQKQLKQAETETKRAEVRAKDEAYRARQSARINAAHAEALKINEERNKKEKEAAAKQAKKDAANQRKQLRQEKVGRFSGGASMALGTAGMAAMMGGNTGMGMGLMGASAVAGLAPMFAGMGPIGWAITGITALTGTLLLADRAAKKAAESQSRYIDSISATTEKMAAIGQLTNKVGASEIYSRKRMTGSADRYTTGFARGKQQFGETFIESEVGKSVFESFKKSLTEGGIDAVKAISVQLAAYVSDGVMTAEQAHSVASQIGIELNNTTLISQISGKLLDLIGPEGQDLIKDPLNVRMRLVQEQMSSISLDKKDLDVLGVPSFDQIDAGDDIAQAANDYFDDYIALFTETSSEKIGASLGGILAQSFELNQAQADSFAKYYDDQIKVLEKQKLQTTELSKQKKITDEISILEEKRNTGLDKFRENNKKILDNIDKSVTALQDSTPGLKALGRASETQVLDKYKGTGQELFATVLTEKTKTLSTDLQIKINSVAGSGILSPESLSQMINMFGTDQQGQTDLRANLELAITKHDPGDVQQLINGLSGVDKEASKKILVSVLQKNPEDFKKTASAIALVQKMAGKEINIQTFFSNKDASNKEIDPTAKLTDLTKALEEVENIKTPITKTALMEMKEIGGVTLDGIIPLWDQWENLPDETKKTVIQEYVTVYKTITDGDVSAEAARRVKAAGGASTIADYYASAAGKDAIRRDLAGERTMQQVNQDIASAKAGAFKDEEKGGKKADPFADIMKRLKNVRNAAIDAAGGFKELQKAIAAAGDKSVANKFVGIEQQLMKKGYSQDFIDYISGLDPDQQKEFGFTATKKGTKKYKEFDYAKGKMVTRTQKYKKGDFVLTDKGNAMRQGMDKAVVGEFQVEQQKVIKNIDEQNKAYAKLKAAGLSNLEIEKAMENQAYVTAIATGQITAQEIKTNNALTKQALLREQIKGLVDKTKTNETRVDALKKTPELINFLSGLKMLNAEGKEVSLSITSIYDAIQNPEDLIKMIAVMDAIKAGTYDAKAGMKELFDLISSSESAKDLEKNLLTPLEKFQKAYDAAMKIFDAYKTMDEYTLKSSISGMADNTGVNQFNGKTFKQLSRAKTESDEALAAMNAELAIYEHQISMIRDEIAKIEFAIENMDVKDLNLTIDGQKVTGKLKYVLEDLKEKISDWEREIEMKYERPIKTLQDESNVLSHDLEVMDYQANKINDRYEEQAKALEEVQKVNESIIRQQEQQLDLADALTQGDIAAAARAAQDMRASNAADFATGQGDALAQARDNAIEGLTNANGLTREQIEERRWQISQQIYALENDPARLAIEQSILQAKDAIYAIEEKREDLLLATRVHEERIYQIQKDKIFPLQDAINLETTKNLALDYQLTVLGNIIAANDRNREVAGMTKDKWEEMLAQMTLMDEMLRKQLKDALDGFNAQSGTAEEIWKRIKDLYDGIKDKEVTVTVKYVTIGNDGSGNGNGDGNGDGNGNGDGANLDEYGLDRNDPDYMEKWRGRQQFGSTDSSGDTGGSKGGATGGSKGGATGGSKGGATGGSKGGATGGSTSTSTTGPGQNTVPASSRPFGGLGVIPQPNTVPASSMPFGGKSIIKPTGGNTVPKSSMPFGGNPIPKPTTKPKSSNTVPASSMPFGGKPIPKKKAAGGLIKYLNSGAFVNFKSLGSDIVPAMLTPGEFVMSKYAVNTHGVDTMKAINNGQSVGDSVYNYSVSVNVKSDANPDEIARAVMTQIQRVNSQTLRSVRI
jgi:hypothetical protein